MRILFTCGGTAGHINPAVALARIFQERHEDCRVLFVGAKGGMETRLVPKEGYECRTVEVYQLDHRLRPRAVIWNLKAAGILRTAVRDAGRIIDEFRPDLVVGTGGYASYPVVKAAARRHIPTAIHESNALPGMTTKALAGMVDVVMVGFEAAKAHYGRAKRVEVTGTPVRPDFYRFTCAEARERLGIPREEPTALCFWGSLGAARMNEYMEDFMALAVKDGVPFRLIQGAGRSYGKMTEALKARGIDLGRYPRLELREYIYDMPAEMAAADLVLCRGAARQRGGHPPAGERVLREGPLPPGGGAAG